MTGTDEHGDAGGDDGRWSEYDRWEAYEREKREAAHAAGGDSKAYEQRIDTILSRLEL